MRENGVREPVIEAGPDGVTFVLRTTAWHELAGGSEDPADQELLGWDIEYYMWLSDNFGGTARSACPDCTTAFTPSERRYCSLHRCRAQNSKGKPCTRPSGIEHAWMYCGMHGCSEMLIPGNSYIRCPERAERTLTQKCAAHRQPRVPAVS